MLPDQNVLMIYPEQTDLIKYYTLIIVVVFMRFICRDVE